MGEAGPSPGVLAVATSARVLEQCHWDVRFVGVSLDGIAATEDAKDHPDAMGRFAVAVSGSITIACNVEDLQDANIGDLLVWEHSESGVHFIEAPPDHRTVKLKSLGPSANVITGAIRYRQPAAIDWRREPDDIKDTAALQDWRRAVELAVFCTDNPEFFKYDSDRREAFGKEVDALNAGTPDYPTFKALGVFRSLVTTAEVLGYDATDFDFSKMDPGAIEVLVKMHTEVNSIDVINSEGVAENMVLFGRQTEDRNRVVGVLLEKNPGLNEARVLLWPG